MAFDPSGQNQRFMSEINVTPFVDVMLVLLVIFMVMAPHFAAMPGLEIRCRRFNRARPSPPAIGWRSA